jgi:hypothetical protein
MDFLRITNFRKTLLIPDDCLINAELEDSSLDEPLAKRELKWRTLL